MESRSMWTWVHSVRKIDQLQSIETPVPRELQLSGASVRNVLSMFWTTPRSFNKSLSAVWNPNHSRRLVFVPKCLHTYQTSSRSLFFRWINSISPFRLHDNKSVQNSCVFESRPSVVLFSVLSREIEWVCHEDRAKKQNLLRTKPLDVSNEWDLFCVLDVLLLSG